jgi:tRNA-specific 2-thiouridylase
MAKKVCVAMSGGVDSSLAAVLLIDQGYDVCGLTMRQFAETAYAGGAYRDAAADAAKVAKHLGIAHYVVDAEQIFKEKVIDYFAAEYASGQTPNPCIRCNRHIKFDFLLNTARELGCEYCATGHYARCENGILHKGCDSAKDQSYFLYVLYECEIDRIIFPLGSMRKKQTRELALNAGLPSASRSESQDICFIPDNDYAAFLKNTLPSEDGPIVDMDGKRLGTHRGVFNYTIGQRKGLGALGRKMFVKEIRPETNTVVVADESCIASTRISLNNFICGPFEIHPGDAFMVQIRYRSPATAGRIAAMNDSEIAIEFDSPVRAVAPGQAAVLYRKDMLVGGGTIQRSRPAGN